MIIELHMIQNFAPSNLNRDDTNAPKDTTFGGYRRARISSQCLKRAIRTHSTFVGTADVKGVRTRLMQQELRQRLLANGLPANEVDIIVPSFLEQYGGLDKDGKTKVLLYLGTDEIERVCTRLTEQWAELVSLANNHAKNSQADTTKKSENGKAELKTRLKEIVNECSTRTKAIDVALFGRMVAEASNINIDAACQVAHAISTHRVDMELDFFTAVDDLLSRDQTGAGMMGTVGFNSSCFYRYSLINLEQLIQNLQDDATLAVRAVESFIRASIYAIPSGKQNSMAAQNLPSFILAVVRSYGSPVSLANAFERPVVPSLKDGESLVAQSIKRLDDYWGKVTRMYGDNGIVTRPVCLLDDIKLTYLGDQKKENIEDLITSVREALV